MILRVGTLAGNTNCIPALNNIANNVNLLLTDFFFFNSHQVKSCAGPPVKYVEARQVQPSAYIDIVALLTPILNIEPDSSMPKGSSSRPPTST